MCLRCQSYATIFRCKPQLASAGRHRLDRSVPLHHSRHRCWRACFALFSGRPGMGRRSSDDHHVWHCQLVHLDLAQRRLQVRHRQPAMPMQGNVSGCVLRQRCRCSRFLSRVISTPLAGAACSHRASMLMLLCITACIIYCIFYVGATQLPHGAGQSTVSDPNAHND